MIAGYYAYAEKEIGIIKDWFFDNFGLHLTQDGVMAFCLKMVKKKDANRILRNGDIPVNVFVDVNAVWIDDDNFDIFKQTNEIIPLDDNMIATLTAMIMHRASHLPKMVVEEELPQL